MKTASLRPLRTATSKSAIGRTCHLFLWLVAVLILARGTVKPRSVMAGIGRPASRRVDLDHTKAAFRSATESGTSSSAAIPDFSRDIEPILRANCYKCHTGDATQARLRLDSGAAVLAGGVSGPAIAPGHSQDSLLVKRILGLTEAPRMPLGGDPLPAEKIALIRAWIDHGDFSHVQAAPVSSVPNGSQASLSGSPLFAEKIRPILASRCYSCHGPALQQNGLRLDSLAAILKGSANGRVVIPGDSNKSQFIRRLLALDRPQMPYGGPPLPKEQVDLFRQWVDQGAPGPDSSAGVPISKPQKHWAYVKPVRPDLPELKNAAWCRNPIDRFVLARLEKEGLSPSPEAEKETLIRRLSLDLIGLPPTLDEVDAFLKDQTPVAYDKLVDRLLASPHYGERWARPWLDLARYADSNGYEKDNLRTAWKYRDWVIDALNQNMSFKDFTIQQIAGDMLPHPATDQLIATGFHRNTLLNQEGGVDNEEQRWYTLVDRVNTTASVWLGSTLGCAECHNHKFDPFPQKDYYRMLAFFDSTSEYQILNLGQGEGWVQEPDVELPTAEQAAKAKDLRAEIARMKQVLDTQTPALDAAQVTWERRMKAAPSQWTLLRPVKLVSEGGATLKPLDDGSVLATGKNPNADNYTFEARTDLAGITAIRLEVMPDPSLPQGGPGRDSEGNFFLSDFEVEASPAVGQNAQAAQKIALKEALADESQAGYLIKNVVEKAQLTTGWAIEAAPAGQPSYVRQAVFRPDKPFGSAGGTPLTIRFKHHMLHASRNIGHFRISVTTTADPKFITEIPARVRPVLDISATQRTAQQKDDIAAAHRAVSPILQPQRDQMAKLEKQLKDLGIVTALVMGEKPSFERPSTYIRIRGTFTSKGDEVFAGVPTALGSLQDDQMPNRLGLANWLVSEDNPLTARVTVNHYWQDIFGHGIVETAEDFGTQGDPPTHPELLDWLATEFMGSGWDVKKIIRLIVTSSTYRQSSRVTPELEERDPYNKLLARGPRFRVEAEMVRDMDLFASGLLSLKIGGPSVFPYQPEGVWDRPYSDAHWVESQGEDRHRRGLYVFVRRTSPYPSLTTFDAPSRESCTVRRVRTNTPLQALTTLNDPVYFEAARALATRIMAGSGDDAARAAYGFRLVLTRRPTQVELDRTAGYYKAELDRFQKDPKSADEVIKGYGNPSRNAAEQAAWSMVSNVLLNLDETITKE